MATPSTGSGDSPGIALIEVVDPLLELGACEQVIQFLEGLGAQRASLRPVPEGLVSLD